TGWIWGRMGVGTATSLGERRMKMDIFWLFFMLSALQPIIKQKLLEASRKRMIALIERERKSRVVLLVHRQETMSLLGFPTFRYIDINDSEEVLRAIHLTDPEIPIDWYCTRLAVWFWRQRKLRARFSHAKATSQCLSRITPCRAAACLRSPRMKSSCPGTPYWGRLIRSSVNIQPLRF